MGRKESESTQPVGGSTILSEDTGHLLRADNNVLVKGKIAPGMRNRIVGLLGMEVGIRMWEIAVIAVLRDS